MKERPILFQGDMVRAILERRKTQTRRVMKPQPKQFEGGISFVNHGDRTWSALSLEGDSQPYQCPYGVPGDGLWVRETFQILECQHDGAAYRADWKGKEPEGKWKPSIFMPRWASRIDLVIVKVRVERVKDITEEDAKAEGVIDNSPALNSAANTLWRDGYRRLWNSINLAPRPIYAPVKGKRVMVSYECFPWSVEDFDEVYPGVREKGKYRGKPIVVVGNPWVWVIEFNRKERREHKDQAGLGTKGGKTNDE